MLSTDYQIPLLIGSSVVAYIAVLVVLMQKSRLQARLDSMVQQTPPLNSAVATSELTLFDHLPYPVLIHNSVGTVTYANPTFQQLVPQAQAHPTLDELDGLLGTRLNRPLHQPMAIRQQLIRSKRLARHYLALSWPISTPHTAQGRVILFCDQTESLKRKSGQQEFEHTLIAYLAQVSHHLHSHLQHPESAAEALRSLVSELESSVRYLELTHSLSHAEHPMSLELLTPLVQEALKDIRSEWRLRSIHLTSVLAKDCRAVVARPDAILALQSMLGGLTSLLSTEQSVNLTLGQAETWAVVTVHIPTLHLKASELRALQDPLHLNSQHSEAHIRFATCKQVMRKVGGSWELQSNPEEGTTCKLRFKVATPHREAH